VRLFVAVEVPEDLRRRLEEVQSGLRDLPLRLRWVRREAMHLTFAFLGEVPAERLDPIEQALASPEASPVGPFRLVVRGLGAFPAGGRPRVIWAGVAGDLPAATRLKASIDSALEPLGFPAERRDFTPHLTIGRVVDSRGRGDWRPILHAFADTEFGSFEVGECVLFESRLHPEGAQYRALRRFPLGAAGTAA
jgi:2'-5' RNA ligase